jgi:transmembrane sensor
MAKGTASSTSLDRAIAWHVRLSAADASEDKWAEFTAWLEADPANRQAFDRVDDLDSELESSETLEGQAASLHAIGEDRAPPRGAKAVAAWMAGAGALLAASLALVYFFQANYFFPADAPPARYATRIGETKVVTLADGSRINLNTATSLTVRVDEAGRQVTLDRGEALFHVARDPRHPFVVTVGDRKVRVVGTVFDVLRSDGSVAVVVAEGRVAVSPSTRERNAKESHLGPGDRLVVTEATGATTIERIDPKQALSWREGYLVYRHAPLSRVVGDLNRYFPVPIVLEDAESAAQRFTGVLRIDSQTSVLRRLSEFLPVTVNHRTDGRIGLRASPAKP